ncbi:alpha/beta hydrolase domain-containing protein [Bacillus sp. FJAT-27251]|uniref:alpha/beta hydrolase domain-containing protein n=1 Tax=Bacillus sp. FJAT-27251 TaxID=1684142 RepID=UPI0006A7F179|nr:alpha/beta hydrolase domain-containing protein [Bacillus sp. FJAT-27251]
MKLSQGITKLVLSATLVLGLFGGSIPVLAAENVKGGAAQNANAHRDLGKIKEAIKTIPSIKEIPYGEGMTFHSEPTPISHPFSSMYSSSGRVDIWNDYGYEEKEFFLSGQANVYSIDEKDTPFIKSTGHDYTTRLLVRFPEDPAKFSGRVYVDILNASSGVDLEDTWGRSYDWYMEEGHAYIGITSKTNTINALKKFDSERYADLNWKVDGKDENGLFWDMLSQLGTMLRSDQAGNLIGGLNAKHVYLTGQSQSGMYLNTYITLFGDTLEKINKGKPLFDGYMNLVGPGTTYVHSGGPQPSETYAETSVPYIVIMSEFEHKFANLTALPGISDQAGYERRPDASSVKNKFRFYEVAGTPHTDPTLDVIPHSSEIALGNGVGRPPKEYAPGHYESDLNLQIFVNAAQENMHRWVTEGIPAPSADDKWLDFDVQSENGKDVYTINTDEHRNALGGIRAPQMEYPIATYYASRNGLPFETNGSMVFFTADKIAKLYPDYEKDYRQPFLEQAQKLLKERYILKEGYDKLVSYVNEKKGFGGPDAEKIYTIANAKPTEVTEVPFDPEAIGFHQEEPDVEANPHLSHPYNSMLDSVGAVDIWEEYDYTEKEFFLSGKANIYELGNIEGNDVPNIASGPHDYTNRILVRMPKDLKDFSGAVYIDILNASNNSDMEDTWRRSWEYFMENGHGYIGITSKDVNVKALKKFDPVRYADIDWVGGKPGQDENGLFWDMLSQLGAALKDEEQSTQILGTEPDFVFLGGQSQSGMYLNTYTNVFQPYLYNRETKQYRFDGYYNWVGAIPTSIQPGGSVMPSLTDRNTPKSIYKAMGVPTMVIMSQAEFGFKEGKGLFPSYKTKKDQNSEHDIFRLYEVAAAPHSDAVSPIIQNNDALVKAGVSPRKYPESTLPNTIKSDLHIDMFVSGALQNLYDFAVARRHDPKADPKNYFPEADTRWVEADSATGQLPRDEHGNVIGGVRHPLADNPLATYMVQNDFMTMFSFEKIQALYGTRENWVSKMNASIDQLLVEDLIPQSVANSDKETVKKYTQAWELE